MTSTGKINHVSEILSVYKIPFAENLPPPRAAGRARDKKSKNHGLNRSGTDNL